MTEIYIEAPLTWALSKNKKFIGRSKKVLNPAYVSARSVISRLVAIEIEKLGIQFEKRKVWVIIIVVKKNRKGDGINLIEGIADAIKTQIGVDDNLFSVVDDWVINSQEKVLIQIKQPSERAIFNIKWEEPE